MEDFRKDDDLDSSTRLIKKAAMKRGIEFNELLYYYDEVPHEIYELKLGDESHLVDITSPDLTSSIANTIADNKYLTHKFLQQLDVPCSPCDIFHSLDKAVTYFEKMREPCVVKPVRGGGGDGVSINITTTHEFIECFLLAKSFCDHVMVEKFIPGTDTRFLVINCKIEAISQREPAFVVGDGKNTLEELILQVNDNRSEGRKGSLSKIKIDTIALNYISKQNLSLQSVPNKDEKIYVRPNANLNTGGISKNISKNLVSDENLKIIEFIASKIGLYVTGIDVISQDISKPLKGQGVICEINDRPRIRMHEMPHVGEPIAVSEKIIDMLFPTTKI